MEAAGTWRQQHNSSESELDPTAHQPRSLTSLLADSRRAPLLPPDGGVSKTSDDEVPEAELESESEFIAVSDNVEPLFQARLLSSPARRDGCRDTSSRELLTDLFPTGFTSNTLSPLGTAATVATDADERKLTSALPLGGVEPELRGRQLWACLMPKAVPAAAVASSNNDAPDVDRETKLHTITAESTREKHLGQAPFHPSWGSSHQPNGDKLDSTLLSKIRDDDSTREKHLGQAPFHPSWGSSHQPSSDELDSTLLSKIRDDDATAELTGLGSSSVKATTATSPGVADLPTTRSKGSLVSDSGVHRVVVKAETADIAGREREMDLKHALDRVVSRLAQSQERVKFLEGNLEQAKHVESGRNALVKQITKLEEEVKHAHHRLEIHRAEALEWREKRQALEAENERLGAELHSGLGRNTRLETENRCKDALLAELRKSVDARAESNSTFEAELRQKDQLLAEAERDKKQAWQATGVSAETAKATITRAETAATEASDLRFLRGDATEHHIKRLDESRSLALEAGHSDNRHGQSLTDVMAATRADGVYGGLEKTRRSSTPAEARLRQRAPLAGQYGNQHRPMYHSPEMGSSADRTVVPPPGAVYRSQNKLGRSSASDSGEGFSIKSDGAPEVLPPRAAATTSDSRTPRTTPRTVSFDEGTSDHKAWSNDDKGLLSPSRGTQEPTTNRSLSTPGSGRRMRVVETPPPAARATGREQCYDGDRQRHDSEGVKGALTGANPAWTDAPSSLGGGSPTAVASRSSGGVAAGVDEPMRTTQTRGHEAKGGGRLLDEEAHEESRYHADTFSAWVDARDMGKVGLRAEDGGPSFVDETSPVPRGWTFQRISPECPAAGHRRGRDRMSSRRSSLCGAGVGVSAGVEGEAGETNPIGTGGNSDRRRESLMDVGGGVGVHQSSRDDYLGEERQAWQGAQGYAKPPPTASTAVSAADNRTLADHRRFSASYGVSTPEPQQRRKSTGGVPYATPSAVKSAQCNETLASLLGNVDPAGGSGTEERSRRDRRPSAPFATDAAEDELRPVREVERRLMLLQMEMSQLEAEQSKLVPKASKTMQARVQLQKIDSRLELLASESSGLRRILREKPWRM